MVVGDAIMEHTIYGSTTKISPEAPVPLVEMTKEEHLVGNLACMIQYLMAFGAEVVLISNVGKDFAGQNFLQIMQDLKVNTEKVSQLGVNTAGITRIVSQNQHIVRVDERMQIDRAELQKFNGIVQKNIDMSIDSCDAVLVLDENMGFLNSILISYLLTISKQKNKKVIVQPESQRFYLFQGVYLVNIPRSVASLGLGVNAINETSIRIMGTKLVNELKCGGVFIPWIEEDSFFFQSDEVIIYPTLLKHPSKNIKRGVCAASALLTLMSAVNAPMKDTITTAYFAASLYGAKTPSEMFTSKELLGAIANGKITD